MKFTSIAAIALIALVASTDALPKGQMYAPGCNKFHTVSGNDSCQSVCDTYHISLNNLYGWNHGLHKNCDNLDNGSKVCIAGPKSGKPPKITKPKITKPKKGKKSKKPKKH